MEEYDLFGKYGPYVLALNIPTQYGDALGGSVGRSGERARWARVESGPRNFKAWIYLNIGDENRECGKRTWSR